MSADISNRYDYTSIAPGLINVLINEPIKLGAPGAALNASVTEHNVTVNYTDYISVLYPFPNFGDNNSGNVGNL